MRRDYCSLADHRYLPQLLALHESLVKHSSEPFTLHVLAMDAECFQTLSALELPHIKIIDLESFEQLMFLGKVRASRTWQEYAWTLASIFTASLLNDGRAVIEVTHSKSSKREFLNGWVGDRIDSITYCDADVYFFSDPSVIFEHIGNRSIGITPHYFPDKYKYLERNGKYCVSIVHFKDTEVGRKCLSRWAGQCREWCFYRNEGDKFGDQKYLDQWVSLYGDEVAEIDHGAALAPWNISAYTLNHDLQTDRKRVARAVDDVGSGPPNMRAGFIVRDVIAFHMHEFLERADGTFRLTNYPLRPEDIDFFYKPYIAAVTAAKERIAAVQSVAG